MRTTFLIYTANKTKRLLYVLDWLFKERLQCDYTITHNIEELNTSSFSIAYGPAAGNALSIPVSGLLLEPGIHQHEIKKASWHNIPILYANDDIAYDLPFDIFSAIFFLLSRYEEYYPYTPDKHKRYPATDSILYKNNWLERPLVDEWVAAFKKLLEGKFQMSIHVPPFSYLPTYDIDIAYSYKHKGAIRNIGGFLKNLLSLNIGLVKERLAVLKANRQDPFDSFDFIRSLHNRYNYRPLYFILAALQTGAFDKNIAPAHPAMQKLIQGFAIEGTVGMHPSYETDIDQQRFETEKSTLEKISGSRIDISRQHFIKMVLPVSYRKLIAHGITKDYSMGYGAHLGFRAGTGSSFFWYDIENETVADLRIYPFCFMDATAHYENKLSAAEAFERLEKMKALLRSGDSMLITVFHNFSLGTDKEWKDWPQYYEAFLKKMAR